MSRAANPWTIWTDLAATTAEMMVASAEVISHRTTRMACASTPPNGPDQREFTRMVDEKVEAGQEAAQAVASGWMAAQNRVTAQAWSHAAGMVPMVMAVATSSTPVQAFGAQMSLMTHMMKPMLESGHAMTALRLTRKALKPYHGRVQANVKRLRAERGR